MESFLLTLREPITRGAQEIADLVEGIACASAVSGRVLLDAAASLTWGIAGELDDMEGVEDAGCVRGTGQAMAFLLSLGRDPASRSGYRSETVRRARPASSHARCQTLPGQGLTSGPWGGPSREWSTMPVSSRGPRRRRSWWCHTCSSTPSTRMPAKRVGSSDAAWERRLDVGPHGIPRSCQLPSQSCNGGSLEAQLSDRPADRPHTQTRPGSTHRVVMLNESRDLARCVRGTSSVA